MANPLFTGIGKLVLERFDRHDHAGRAKGALKGPLVDEGLLNGMKVPVGGQSLDGLHLAAVGIQSSTEQELTGRSSSRTVQAPHTS